ncbi:MAG: T9SS type A sorting domain-containing protein [Bacteroidetes bacterium]|nr:T9SS type A sorting domain-containing protein [Bacteroidota bacterium]
MRQLIIFLLMLCGNIFSAIAQDTLIEWQKNYIQVGEYDEHLSGIVETANGNFVFGSEDEGYIEITEFNGKGGKIREKGYGHYDHNWIGNFRRAGNHYVACGINSFYKYRKQYMYDSFTANVMWMDTAGKLIWSVNYADSGIYNANDILYTNDKQLLICGYSYGILKLDTMGKKIWYHSYPGKGIYQSGFTSITQAADSGYLFAGYRTDSSKGKTNIRVIRTDKNGNLKWDKSYGGSKDDEASCIINARDGGFIIAGYTKSKDGDVKGFKDSSDAWIFKINDTGKIVWQKTFGGSDFDFANDIVQAPDSTYLVAGSTSSNNGDIKSNHGWSDAWIFKIRDTTLLWSKTYGGSESDAAIKVLPTSDNGIIFTAHSNSSGNGDLKGDSTSGSEGSPWLVKLKGHMVTNIKEDIKTVIEATVNPNPIRNTLHLSISNISEPVKINIMNIQGKNIEEFNFSPADYYNIPVNGLIAGVYILQCTGKDFVITKKFVKE